MEMKDAAHLTIQITILTLIWAKIVQQKLETI